jgi:hypothetical protein
MGADIVLATGENAAEMHARNWNDAGIQQGRRFL